MQTVPPIKARMRSAARLRVAHPCQPAGTTGRDAAVIYDLGYTAGRLAGTAETLDLCKDPDVRAAFELGVRYGRGRAAQ